MKKLFIILLNSVLSLTCLAQQLLPQGKFDLMGIRVPTTTTSILLDKSFLAPFSNVTGTASDYQSVLVTWFLLSTNVSMNALTNFEYSYDHTNWFSSLSISRGSGSGDTTVYVRVKASAPAGTYTGIHIQFQSSPANPVFLDVQATVAASGSATITRSPTSLNLDTTEINTPGDAFNVTVTGANLTAGITVGSAAGIDYSFDNGLTFVSSGTITQSGGTANFILQVRLASAASAGNISGTIHLNSTGATQVDITFIGVIGTPTGPPLGEQLIMDINFSQTAQLVAGKVNFFGNPNCFLDSSITDSRSGDDIVLTIYPSQWGGGGSPDNNPGNGCSPAGLHASSNTLGVSNSTVTDPTTGLSQFFDFETTWAGTTAANINMKISGLTVGKHYRIWAFCSDGSSISCPSGRQMTPYWYDSTSHLRADSIAGYQLKANLSDTLGFHYLKLPDASGNMYGAWHPIAGGNSGNCSQYAEINELKIYEEN
jgi:hypothetical protein